MARVWGTILGLAAVLGLAGPAAAGGAAAPTVTVIVTLADAPLATYRGGLPGLYRAYLGRQHAAFEAAARASIPGARVLHRYDTVLGGVALQVPADAVGGLAALPGVRAVHPDRLLQLDTTRSPSFIGATSLWGRLGGQRNAGEGVIVAVLDTGIWPEHPAFSDPDPWGQSYGAPPPPARACQFSGGVTPGPAFACNGKLIGAQRFMAAYEACATCAQPAGDFTSARDGSGHGTHTASTAAGNGNVRSEIFGRARGVASGIAPRARLIAYKVCGADGCFASDAVAAIQQAVLDGADVLNFSISGGTSPYDDPVELAFLDAYAAGVFVAASAGNGGPALGSVNHRGPWVTTVGATTENRQFESRLSVSAPGASRLTLEGASITPGLSAAAPVVVAATAGDPRCLEAGPDGAFAGAVVVCKRGEIARIAKSFHVAQRGAVAMILYDDPADPTQRGVNPDNHSIPTVHLSTSGGISLLAFLKANAGATATFTAGTAASDHGDVLAAFSARGGASLGLAVAKPDLTAPGVQILAGHTPDSHAEADPDGEIFQVLQGTSMASPHVAGAAALLKAYRPDWTPGQIKSALMTTASTRKLLKQDGVTPAEPFDVGSGRLDLKEAYDPGITLDVPAQDYLDQAGALWAVNYPSVYLPAGAPAVATVTRVLRSELPRDTVWEVVVTSPRGARVTAPASVTVPAAGVASLAFTVDKSAVPAAEVRHGALELKSGSRRVRLPLTAVGAHGLPDLVISALSASSPVTAGGDIALEVTIANVGAGNAGGFAAAFYVSPSPVLGPEAVYFGSCVVPSGLASGQPTSVCSTTTAFSPAAVIAPGSYYVIGVADASGTVGESNEGNNRAVWGPVIVQ